MSQQNTSRQPTSYPSPHSYPSPSMSAYAYPPPQQQQQQQPQAPQQTVESYRASPTGSHVSLPSLSLPPIRAIDPRNPPQGQAPMGSPLPPPVAPMGGYYPQQGQSLPPPQQHINVTSSPHNQGVRYPISAPDGRIMSGGRHKKEIKRRTKTGCLTCRKRRIKCDEAHPTCRNCQKSKRECLGYDPIFKSQPAPAAIQPAPSGAPGSNPSQGPNSSTSASFPPLPSGFAAPVSAGFAPALSAEASSPGSSVEPYEYSSAIDPALEAAGSAQMTMSSSTFEGTQGFRQDLKRGIDSASPYSSAASDAQNPRGGVALLPLRSFPSPPSTIDAYDVHNVPIAYIDYPAKRIKIDDLFAIGGVAPPHVARSGENASPLTPEVMEEMKNVYLTVYAPAIDQFLETSWYFTKGLTHLLDDTELCQLFGALLERFRAMPTEADSDALALTHSLEAQVVWSLMGLPRIAHQRKPRAENANGAVDEEAVESQMAEEPYRRFLIFESLMTRWVLTKNLTLLTQFPPSLQAGPKGRELDFWRLLGEAVTKSEDEFLQNDLILASARTLLDNQENRDVIYSIAVCRHLGPHVPGFPNQLAKPTSHDERDNQNKIVVAKTFLEREANGMMTNAVFSKICGMAASSWNAPMVVA
ncbi:MAG: hypothetical protein M1833_001339 [Piccolia ochrophora]|nr:MAG: hypothetical protein M1833_001339 [Piccolia ochrophora]